MKELQIHVDATKWVLKEDPTKMNEQIADVLKQHIIDILGISNPEYVTVSVVTKE